MKKFLISSLACVCVMQIEVVSAGVEVVKNPTVGQGIYWTFQNDEVSPCAWHEAWEVIDIQNNVVKLKKLRASSASFTGEEKYKELGQLKSWSSEEEAKRISDTNDCHLKQKFEGK
ncbi:hypothetical protein SAMN05421644_1342 [Allochromatium warmingii]|uniref:Uncharacterized protein n=1 Tax=Allochromatium warmingii TaxID=61595 RepID=A0A1H3HJD2_ALLWA|nr:hypothetical protein [Allochromatium warmingii]SDY15656.1 hypothetical protein SAMN05421644_1342 [Allochromatium warmingii]